MADEPESMDTEKVLEQLNRALELQGRSLLQFTQASGSMFGIEVQGVAGKLIDTEDEVTEALHAVIPHSGQEAASEAPEHLMEQVIMRKQNQIDWLRRARRQP